MQPDLMHPDLTKSWKHSKLSTFSLDFMKKNKSHNNLKLDLATNMFLEPRLSLNYM